MPPARLPRGRRAARCVLGVTIATIALAATGCGEDKTPAKAAPDQAVQDCRERWHEVGESVLGLDQETTPSGLASRWTSVLATVNYYETSARAGDCTEAMDLQVRAISDLRRFSDSVRPYDMSFQLHHLRAAVDLYLHDDLPEPVTGANGKPVPAPTKKTVMLAFQTLERSAATADAELQPAWAKLATVDLDDAEALRVGVEELDALARTSSAWVECQAALGVLLDAVRAQEGLAPSPTPSPTPTVSPTESPTPTPSGTPTGIPLG